MRFPWFVRFEASRLLTPFVMALGAVGSVAMAAESPPSASMILQELRAFRECGSVLYIAAHPDDENTQFLAYLARGRGVRTGYLSLTRGEGGQDLIGPEIGDPLGVIRTQELLAARRIDGAEQFFTNARDFGFSKSYEQTLAKWGKQEVLGYMVRTIRAFRPDVIVTRFPAEPGGTHGHHTASTVLALEAFKTAANREVFQIPWQDEQEPWQASRLYWNSFRDAHGSAPPLRLDIGGYLPLLGESIGEIAARSRSSHRSQGYGSVAVLGSRMDDFQPLDGKPAGKDLFEGIDTTWARWPGLAEVSGMVDEVIGHFDPQNPSASVPAVLRIIDFIERKEFTGAKIDPMILRKLRDLRHILQDCLGLSIETTAAQPDVVWGETLRLRHTVILRSDVPVTLVRVDKEADGATSVQEMSFALHRDQPVSQELTWQPKPNEPDHPLSHPYWLRGERTPGLYRGEAGGVVGEAENPPDLEITDTILIYGAYVRLTTEPSYVAADPAKGEVRRKIDVIAPVSLTPARDVELFTPGCDRTVEIDVRAYRPDQEGTLQITVPRAWSVTPPSQPFHLAAAGDHVLLEFTVHTHPPSSPRGSLNGDTMMLPSQQGSFDLLAQATISGRTYDTTRQEIRYDHIPFQLLQPPASVKAVCLDLQIRGKTVGYLPGAGDKTAEALEAMGYAVTTLSGADLTAGRLRAFDAVVVGVRAFNVRTDLAAGLPALFAYAENGGTLIEQYNTPGELKTTKLAPYALELSRDLPRQRVTDENASVTLLVPDHPAFNAPNRLTPADFDGWVQERGLNFPVTWDQEHFEALLACSDAGEPPLKSGLLVAHYGKGYFVYTGLSFFRQLPAGVPGAYRLFANLVSLGK